MMTDSVTEFYKKAGLAREVLHKALLGVCSVGATSNNCEVQELVREFRERGLQNLLSNLPVQSYSTWVQR